MKQHHAAAYTLTTGSTPVLISMPHNSAEIPDEIKARMHPFAHQSPDTDWFVDRLYECAPDMGLSVLKPSWSRYVIDLNRPPDDQNLYPGADTTGLVPISSFDSHPIYKAGQEPDQIEIQNRLEAYWQPYHQTLEAEIKRIHSQFGMAIVFEAHSIASHVPRFFEGQLPDLNFGTANGTSCSNELSLALTAVAQSSDYSWVLNGRFKGGYITRAYAKPANQIHCMQLELSQATYLNEADGSWDPKRAAQIQPVLQKILKTALAWSQRQ